MSYAREYPWVANKYKLAQSIAKLEADKQLDPKVEINEETIKAEYVKRAGLVIPSKSPVSKKEVKEEAAVEPEEVEEKPKAGKKTRE